MSLWIACRIADFCYARSSKDRRAVRENLSAVLGTDGVSPVQVREVFRNFGIYLVDFFRFSRLNREEIHRWIHLEGLERMQGALRAGKGAIGLTAHLGNFELAGAVLSLLGMPVKALVLTHQNPQVDAFFRRQRESVGVTGIPVTPETLKSCFEASCAALRRNEILALVGDRDFFDHGLELPLFGRTLQVPKGPAVFSLRTGAPIVPGFLVRNPNGTYRFILEDPISVPNGLPQEEAVRRMMQECLNVMARYIRQYPTQWYLFQEFWRPAPGAIL